MAGEGFQWLDYILFSGILLLSTGMGLWAAYTGRHQKTAQQFLVGNRDFNPIPVTISIFMSFASAITVLGMTAEMYLYGLQFVLNVVGLVLSNIYCALVFVPFFYDLKMTSTFEYLERRYDSKAVRCIGDALYVSGQIFYMSLTTFAPATAFEALNGFPVWVSIVIEVLLATFYTSIGGMKALVWTDAIQGMIYFGGLIFILVMGRQNICLNTTIISRCKINNSSFISMNVAFSDQNCMGIDLFIDRKVREIMHLVAFVCPFVFWVCLWICLSELSCVNRLKYYQSKLFVFVSVILVWL